MTMGISSRRTVPAATAAGERARWTRLTPTTTAPNPCTETIQPTLPKNPPESTTPPDTSLPTTTSTFPIHTPERSTDSCQVCDRAPAPAPFRSGTPGC
jgi:hypothetical protein